MISVSVIIPYFKKKKFIEKTVNSILLQSFKNFEIIIIYDDEDHSDLKLIKKIKNNDKRIRLVVNKRSLGAGRSRNEGIKRAKGKYIAFIDADDLWRKDKIKFQLRYMIKNNLKISHTSYEILKVNQTKKK